MRRSRRRDAAISASITVIRRRSSGDRAGAERRSSEGASAGVRAGVQPSHGAQACNRATVRAKACNRCKASVSCDGRGAISRRAGIQRRNAGGGLSAFRGRDLIGSGAIGCRALPWWLFLTVDGALLSLFQEESNSGRSLALFSALRVCGCSCSLSLSLDLSCSRALVVSESGCSCSRLSASPGALSRGVGKF